VAEALVLRVLLHTRHRNWAVCVVILHLEARWAVIDVHTWHVQPRSETQGSAKRVGERGLIDIRGARLAREPVK